MSTVSTVYTPSNTRTSRQTLTTLLFIHRFRLVTVRHIQILLQHATPTTTYRQINILRAKGLMDRLDATTATSSKLETSYFLTPKGLELLKEQQTLNRYRHTRTLQTDAKASLSRRMHFHILADVYIHFKRHYDGHFSMFTDLDLARLENIPEQIPDGFVRVSLPDHPVQYYFIEIYGWNRSTQVQAKRINSYIQFAESCDWRVPKGNLPGVFIAVSSSNAQDRIEKQLRIHLRDTLSTDLHFYTTVATKLDGDQSSIWRKA